MSNHLKNIVYCSILVLFLQSCSSSPKTSPPKSENMESSEMAENQAKKEYTKEDISAGTTLEEAEAPTVIVESKPLNQIVIPEQKFVIERIINLKDEVSESNVSSESENEQLSVTNKHAKVLLFAKKLEKGSYPIAKNNLPYATVEVTLMQGQEKIEGKLENGIVKLLVLDSAGITKGNFEGTLIKNNERYFIGGNFSN
ncbi:hypothetical protein Fleli_2994 [Bernardetia litoralis DSM 6794]|uniref:Lipoprotein n=2 Tax=Bernardetia litoralis TaxID=999 RepID=I4AN01_BERLS|nr:hypothetical protein Fleli_2994 [Bernardetia litoralis DSM 6794]